MSSKEKAEDLVNRFRIVLMNEDTDCGNEILCTCISVNMALITVDELLQQCYDYRDVDLGKSYDYWQEVKKELINNK